MEMQPWHYFLSLERDLIRTVDFVEIAPNNSITFSIEYVKLLLLVGSEVDVVAKMLCTSVAPGKSAGNIVDYRNILTAAFRGIHGVEISIPRYGLTIKPWSNWDPAIAKTPNWWSAYNDVKHERDRNFPAANQGTVLEAFCGLLALLLYHYRADLYLQPSLEMLWCAGLAEHLTSAPAVKLPGA